MGENTATALKCAAVVAFYVVLALLVATIHGAYSQ